MRPLKGITVVTLEHAIAAPFATRQLADLGARVIKIERPGVGRLRPRLRRARARPGVALRLDQPLQGEPDARRQASRGRADAASAWSARRPTSWCRTWRPAPRRGWACGYEGSSAAKPALIVCDISGYGDDPVNPGPYRDKKAYDLLIQSESGFVSVTGTPDEPCKAGPSIADIAAGMYAYTQHPGRAAAARPDRQGPAHRHLDAGVAGRVDELSAVLRLRRRGAAAAHRRQPRHDLSLRPVSRRRRQRR